MEYKIGNEYLTVTVSSKGGELRSIKDADGKEYLWQGDEATWTDRAPNLFPYIGRMTGKSYTYKGKTYSMDIHGFLMYMEMALVEHKADELVLSLESCEATRAQYPFEFRLEIRWKLDRDKLTITYGVDNCDEKTMYFGIGGHPGFQIPMEEGKKFEDYFLDFGVGSAPRKEILSDDCFMLEKDEPFELRDGQYLDLRHDLFDNDAIVLNSMSRWVCIDSRERGKRAVVVEYNDMDYLGIWHWPKTEVNYVCIEPWTSLPSRKDVVEDIEQQKNLIALEAGKHYCNSWSISIVED